MWSNQILLIIGYQSTTEFPIPLLVIFRHVLFWEFPCPAWVVASCSSGPQAGELLKTKPKNLYEWWDGKLCKWEIPRCMMYSGCKRKFDVVAFEKKYNKSLSNTSSKSGAKRPKKWENLYNICRSQSICVIPRMIKVKFWSTSILCNATQADLYLGLGTDIQIRYRDTLEQTETL